MSPQLIIRQLQQDQEVFGHLLSGISEDEFRWKPAPDKWCLLEIVCHLNDEEREDFRTRVRVTLATPGQAPPPIDPVTWVTERRYLEKDYEEMLGKFLAERQNSITWLQSLSDPPWENGFEHPKMGFLTARFFLTNWLAHDYHHIRQINALKYGYLKASSGIDLGYAGNW